MLVRQHPCQNFKDVNEEHKEVVATDTVGRPVADLTVSDIEVLENGQSMRGFGLSRVEDLPVFATLIYDANESNEKTWLRMQEPVSRFLRRTITIETNSGLQRSTAGCDS